MFRHRSFAAGRVVWRPSRLAAYKQEPGIRRGQERLQDENRIW